MLRGMAETSDATALLDDVRSLHEAIRVAVAERLELARSGGDRRLASEPGEEGAGDLGYALDAVADAPLEAFVARVGARRPVTLVAEGPGESSAAPEGSASAAGVRVLVDPVDGTRPLMLDMRSAWVLTGVAPDRGPTTRLSDVTLAVQTELPTTGAAVYHVLTAERGRGATMARHDVRTGALLDEGPLRVHPEAPLDNGFFSFTRYLPAERPFVWALEQAFLERALPALGLDPRLLYEDQYLCTAGQLFLLATGRYRLLADLRARLAQRTDVAGFSAKPYDLSTLLIFEEAGVVVHDAEGRPLDAPLDTETALDVVAYGSERVRAAYEPHLRAALEAVEAAPSSLDP